VPRLALLLLLLVLLSSCRYVRNRVRDLGDPFRISVGAGSVVGVRAKAVGLVDTGLMMGVKPNAAALGWRYGTPLFFNEKDPRVASNQAEIFRTTSMVGMDYVEGSYRSAQKSVAVLPALFTWTDATPRKYDWLVPETGDQFRDRSWLWSRETARRNRYAQIHAFDVEGEVGLVVYLDVGFSPGEFLDFLLGFFGIDIAHDDEPGSRQ